MGKTYRERIEAIMAEYHKVLDKARAEFMHYGEVKDDTDARLTALEDKLEFIKTIQELINGFCKEDANGEQTGDM